jgi:glyoxylase-like metal-dependent hydrolase (beta-lactamase superfamily II)
VIDEIRPGLKRWALPHPEFDPVEGDLDESYTDVACVLYEAETTLVFIDPLVPDELWPVLDAEVKRSGKPVVVLTTIYFHERTRDEVARRYGGRLGGDVPGVRAFFMERGDEHAFWLESARTLVFGDAVLGDQQGGLRMTPWARDAAGLERTRQAVEQLLELPVVVVLTAHGSPVLADGREALARAVAT